MNEGEWLGATDPQPMLAFLRGPSAARIVPRGSTADRLGWDAPARTSRRKLRLVACACCRRVWDLLTDLRSRELVEANEVFADHAASEGRLAEAWEGARAAHSALELDRPFNAPFTHWAAQAVLGLGQWLDPVQVLRDAAVAVGSAFSDAYRAPEWEAQAALIRDVVGNPFRPAALAPLWQTDTARAIAAGMYESRDFSAMDILADALQDAGCDNEDVLTHCRGEGPHVRGCLVVDLVLGKE